MPVSLVGKLYNESYPCDLISCILCFIKFRFRLSYIEVYLEGVYIAFLPTLPWNKLNEPVYELWVIIYPKKLRFRTLEG